MVLSKQKSAVIWSEPIVRPPPPNYCARFIPAPANISSIGPYAEPRASSALSPVDRRAALGARSCVRKRMYGHG
jgi:hypothetical protein